MGVYSFSHLNCCLPPETRERLNPSQASQFPSLGRMKGKVDLAIGIVCLQKDQFLWLKRTYVAESNNQ